MTISPFHSPGNGITTIVILHKKKLSEVKHLKHIVTCFKIQDETLHSSIVLFIIREKEKTKKAENVKML